MRQLSRGTSRVLPSDGFVHGEVARLARILESNFQALMETIPPHWLENPESVSVLIWSEEPGHEPHQSLCLSLRAKTLQPGTQAILDPGSQFHSLQIKKLWLSVDRHLTYRKAPS